MIFDRGETVPRSIDVRNAAGALYNPDISMKITITDPLAVVVVNAQSMTNDSTGVYHYNWLSLSNSELGTYTVEYVAVDTTSGTTIQYGSFVLAVVSPCVGTSLAAMIDEVSIVLEDPSNAIFSDAVITQHLNTAVIHASRYVPYESKETITLAASTDVDISAIDGLKRIVKAEYPAGQKPKAFRNVSVFGGIATIETDLMPAADDEAYLYCEKMHVLDSASSTLTPELEPIVVELAAGNAAQNNVGSGRTQILSAITAVDLVNSTVDGLTVDVAQAVTDLGTIRTNLGTMLTAVQIAIDLGNAQNDLGVIDLATIRSTLTTMLTNVQNAIDLANAQTDLGVTDISDARTAFGATETAIATAIGDIAARITQAIADFTSGRSLINTITIGTGPESQYANYAVGELNTASSTINEARAMMQQGSNLAGQLQNAANHEMAAAMSYLQQAQATLSKYVSDVGHLGSAVSQAVNVCNGYLGEAHATLSKWVSDLNTLNAVVSHDLSVANGHLNQAHGYVSEFTGRLSISNVIMSYSNWGRAKVQEAEQELKALARPKQFVTYPRG